MSRQSDLIGTRNSFGSSLGNSVRENIPRRIGTIGDDFLGQPGIDYLNLNNPMLVGNWRHLSGSRPISTLEFQTIKTSQANTISIQNDNALV